jgi:hypothetical protein
MSDNVIPKGNTLWQWTDTLTKDGSPFLFLAGDAVSIEITHSKSGAVVERTATFTVGSNDVSYRPVADDVSTAEMLHLRWKITRGGLVGHIPTSGSIQLTIV